VALVFVHGWLCDSRYWRLQVPAFEDRYRVITLDLAGHGESGFGRELWTMQSFAADVAAVVRATETDRIVLVGHSMGGPVVVEAARILGERVIGVIGVDTFRMSDPMPADQQAEAFAGLQTDFGNTVRDFVATTMFVATSDPQLRDSIANDMAEGPAVVGLGAGEGLLDYPAEERLGRLDKPFVLINSDYQPTESERVLAAAPQARIETISGAGHFLMLEKPAQFNAALDRAIEELIAGTATSRGD
jgi:pimeloyl-ACP methyl ester carboxylesterase